jgi:hypothetical protein
MIYPRLRQARNIYRLCYTPTRTTRRLSLNEIRAWRQSCAQARAIEADGGLPISTILGYWGRVSWRTLRPCVYARRNARNQGRWNAANAVLVGRPS